MAPYTGADCNARTRARPSADALPGHREEVQLAPEFGIFGVHDGKEVPTLCGRVPPQMIELVRAGRRPEELAKEFELSAQAIPQLDRAGRPKRGPARGWPDDGGARGSSTVCGVRTASSNWSARSSQKQRPGSLGRRM